MIPNNQFFFNNGKGSSSILPNALLLTWYNSLITKPSDTLMTDLNTLSQGLFDDGNWAKLDLFGLIAGMETQEQRLRPLITTSGDDFVIVGTPILDANGVSDNSGTGYLDLKWNPSIDGSEYTLNSASMLSYSDQQSTLGASFIMGGIDTSWPSDSTLGKLISTTVYGSINLDYDIQVDFPQIEGLAGNSYHISIKVNAGDFTLYKNGTSDVAVVDSVAGLPNVDFFGAAINIDGVEDTTANVGFFERHFMTGSGTINHLTVQSRLNTFYTSRGL